VEDCASVETGLPPPFRVGADEVIMSNEDAKYQQAKGIAMRLAIKDNKVTVDTIQNWRRSRLYRWLARRGYEWSGEAWNKVWS